jgi:hypothetical protein
VFCAHEFENHPQLKNMTRSLLPFVVASFAIQSAAQQCQNLTVPIDILGLQYHFDLTAPQSNIDVGNFILELTRPGANYTKDVLLGEKSAYSIH